MIYYLTIIYVQIYILLAINNYQNRNITFEAFILIMSFSEYRVTVTEFWMHLPQKSIFKIVRLSSNFQLATSIFSKTNNLKLPCCNISDFSFFPFFYINILFSCITVSNETFNERNKEDNVFNRCHNKQNEYFCKRLFVSLILTY